MVDPVKQWMRVCEVVVGTGGSGLSVINLRIKFEIAKTVESAPNVAIIKIFNLHPDNETKIKNEFDEVLLKAGYSDAPQMIFRGTIKHVYRYRDGNDYITEIEAGDGDKDFRTAIMNETVASGTSVSHLITKAVSSFTGGTTQGEVQVVDKQRIRGKVVSGNTRDVLTNIAREAGANWSIQDGVLMMIKTNDVAKGDAVVITSETGMLGAPEINDKGIVVKCLLNPVIKINGAIKLDNNGIKAKRVKAQALATKREKQEAEGAEPVRLDPDGIYKVLKVTHRGDTRDKEWLSEIECIGLDQPIPASR